MSTLIWPPASQQTQAYELTASADGELQWLLLSLQDTLKGLKAGLDECADLLAPKEPGSTLVLSSLRSEHLKGFITRVGTRVVKGDIQLRLPSLPPLKGQASYRLTIASQPDSPTLYFEQLTLARSLINACLDVVDTTIWTGDNKDANFISSQLRLLHENVREAKDSLKGWTEHQKPWNDDPTDPNAFSPPLPPNVSVHLSISDAAVLLHVRTLEAAYSHTGSNTPLPPGTPNPSLPTYSGMSLRERLAGALGGTRPIFHDEAHETFVHKGQEVRVRDKVRVESQDPSLMSALAKLAALERNVALSRHALAVVMGKDFDEIL